MNGRTVKPSWLYIWLAIGLFLLFWCWKIDHSSIDEGLKTTQIYNSRKATILAGRQEVGIDQISVELIKANPQKLDSENYKAQLNYFYGQYDKDALTSIGNISALLNIYGVKVPRYLGTDMIKRVLTKLIALERKDLQRGWNFIMPIVSR